MKGPLDAIFCRNVVIYFDKDTQRDLFARMRGCSGRAICCSSATPKRCSRSPTDYSLIGRTIYRRAE